VSELKPCPFCGSDKVSRNGTVNESFIECENCHAFGPPDSVSDVADVLWDRRPDSAEIERMRKCVEVWRDDAARHGDGVGKDMARRLQAVLDGAPIEDGFVLPSLPDDRVVNGVRIAQTATDSWSAHQEIERMRGQRDKFDVAWFGEARGDSAADKERWLAAEGLRIVNGTISKIRP